MCSGVLGITELRQWAKAFNKHQVQLVYSFVTGFQGFLCKYSHPAVSHRWLHQCKQCRAAELCWESNTAAQPSWVDTDTDPGVHSRSGEGRTAGDPRCRVEMSMHKRLSLRQALQPGRAHTAQAPFPVHEVSCQEEGSTSEKCKV